MKHFLSTTVAVLVLVFTISSCSKSELTPKLKPAIKFDKLSTMSTQEETPVNNESGHARFIFPISFTAQTCDFEEIRFTGTYTANYYQGTNPEVNAAIIKMNGTGVTESGKTYVFSDVWEGAFTENDNHYNRHITYLSHCREVNGQGSGTIKIIWVAISTPQKDLVYVVDSIEFKCDK